MNKKHLWQTQMESRRVDKELKLQIHLINEQKIAHIKKFSLDRNNVYENIFSFINSKIKQKID